MKLRSRVLTALNLLPSIVDQGLREQLQIAAQNYETTADIANARAVIPAEVCNRLEVRRQSAGQPHQFYIASAFAFQMTAGLDPVEVAIGILKCSVACLRSSPSMIRLIRFPKLNAFIQSS